VTYGAYIQMLMQLRGLETVKGME